LSLLSGDGALLARADDTTVFDAALENFALPESGLYFLIAGRFGGAIGTTSGAFSLRLERTGIAADPRLQTGAVALRYGDNVVGELNDAQFRQLYTFGALRGDLVTVTMQRISGDLDSVLTLADSDGNVLLINDEDAASPGTLDAAIRGYRVLRSGNYLLAAARFGEAAGSSRGAFSLRLERVAPEALGSTPEQARLLESGVAVGGSIDDDTVRQYYLIEARAGDSLNAEVRRGRGSLDPALELLTPDGRRLAVHDSGARGVFARITAYPVIVDGAFLLVVTRFNGADGATAGEYTLTLRVERQ
jgi:hypothetical protein